MTLTDCQLLAGGLAEGLIRERPSLQNLYHAFRRLTDQQIENLTQKRSKKREGVEKDPLIRCKTCGHIITTVKTVISVAGLHRHSFTNPAGIHYTIGCFSTARGCSNMGEPTTEHTWFPGFTWCYSVCSKCYNHMGWYYQSGDNTFYGLILNRLEGGG
jgi:hypothetical protein